MPRPRKTPTRRSAASEPASAPTPTDLRADAPAPPVDPTPDEPGAAADLAATAPAPEAGAPDVGEAVVPFVAKADASSPAPTKKAPSAPRPSRMPAGKVRLHKFLAATGAGSRRECETFIEQGRVSVNGVVVTKLGTKVDPSSDHVRLDGERAAPEEKVYYLLHKPAGVICTNSDERGRMRAVDVIRDEKHRVYTVGRLDAESTGLIVVTNDGGITNVICHPRYRIEKTYHVVVRGEMSREQLAQVEAGVWLSEGKSSPARVRAIARNPKRNETLIEITLFEGRNREVRRIFARVGFQVRRLMRVRLGPLELGELPLGAWRKLTDGELAFVREAEALYAANKDAWDAEIPVKPPKLSRPFRPKRRGKARGPGGGRGFSGPPRGGRFGPPRGPRGDRPFGDRSFGGGRPPPGGFGTGDDADRGGPASGPPRRLYE